jgi:hypothetical protein
MERRSLPSASTPHPPPPPVLGKRTPGPASRRGGRTPQLAQELRAEAQLLSSMASLIELIGTKPSITTLVKAAQELAAYIEITTLWLEDNQVDVPSVSKTVKAAKKLLDTTFKVPEAGKLRRHELFEEQVLVSPRIVRVESSVESDPLLEAEAAIVEPSAAVVEGSSSSSAEKRSKRRV